MREYAKVAPTIWTGTTGKQIRALGRNCQVLAFYLLTNPHANMLGLYYLPLPIVAHETGIPLEEALEGLQRLSEVGFCAYDPPSEFVWVYEMARFQIGGPLKATDNRVVGVRREYAALPKNPFLKGFFERYRTDFHLDVCRDEAGPSQGAVKPHRSQEQEQEIEQEQESHIRAREKPSGRASGKPSASLQAERDREGFERVKRAYPKFAGRQDWISAEHYCRLRLEEGETWETLEAAARRYAAFCDAVGRTGTQLVLSPAKFFSAADRPWAQSWEIPESKPLARARSIAAGIRWRPPDDDEALAVEVG